MELTLILSSVYYALPHLFNQSTNGIDLRLNAIEPIRV